MLERARASRIARGWCRFRRSPRARRDRVGGFRGDGRGGCATVFRRRNSDRRCRPSCRARWMKPGGLDFAISLHEEDRALSCGGALNAGAVSKRSGRQPASRFGGDRTRAPRSGDRDRLGRAGSCRTRFHGRVARTCPRGAQALRQCHLRGDAASFHARRKRRADLGSQRQNEPAAA